MEPYIINVDVPVSVSEIYSILKDRNVKIQLDPKVIDRITKNRKYLETKIGEAEGIYYGINTGFGSLCDIKISDEDLEKLQENLVLSHACGMGAIIDENISRLVLFLKIRNLCYGVSGVRIELVQKLVQLYNSKISPVIYEMGSLGASGDLAPLAHLSLVLLGKGSVFYKGSITTSIEALQTENIETLKLKAKEGLALLNGTQFSLAYAVNMVTMAERYLLLANKIAALSMDAFQCDIKPFDPLLHQVRPHKGQIFVAKQIYNYLAASETRQLTLKSVQDPYSFRCVPQVHGASYHAIMHAKEVIEVEVNSVTDNPNVFDIQDKILSGGNFHAQPLALVLDYLAIALAELGSISERRVYQLINGDRGLPLFLTPDPGLNSGFMIVQYTAASIVSQNKQLCTPASVDSIVSSKGQEDHVSMAANSATKGWRVLNNVRSLLAIELFTACQAFEFRRPIKSSPELEKLIASVRENVFFLESDNLMHDNLSKVEMLITQLADSMVSDYN